MKRVLLAAMMISITPIVCMDKSQKEANKKRYLRKQEKHAKLKKLDTNKVQQGKQPQVVRPTKKKA